MVKKCVLITGLGAIGQRHVRCLRKIYGKKIDIIAFRKRNLNHIINDRLEMIKGDPCKEYDLELADSLEGALNKKPFAIFITNPPDLHLTTAIKAAKAKSHIFIEKPLSHNLKNIGLLQSLIHRNNLICRLGQQFRFHPFTKKIKNIIDNKTLGSITSAEFIYKEYLPGMHPYEDYKTSHASESERGGGVVLSLNHYIDIVCYLFGFPDKIVSMVGKGGSLDIKAEHTSTIIMQYYDRNFGNDLIVTIMLDFIKRPKQMEWSITGENGSLNADFINNSLSVSDFKNKDMILKNFDRNTLFLDEQKDFFDIIDNKNKDSVLPNLEESKQILKLTLDSLKSASSNKFLNFK